MTKQHTLGAILYEGFEMLDLYGPLEMFGCLPDRIKIVTVAEKGRAVKASNGPKTVVDYHFDDCPPLDLIVLPGGFGTVPELANEALLAFLRKHVAVDTTTTLSVCTGSALLAKAGVLDGKRATTNKMFFELATRQSDKTEWAEAARWVEDGNIFTASGVSAGIDASLAMIAKLYGVEVAEHVAKVSEYEWQRDAERDPFVQYLNEGDTDAILERFGG